MQCSQCNKNDPKKLTVTETDIRCAECLKKGIVPYNPQEPTFEQKIYRMFVNYFPGFNTLQRQQQEAKTTYDAQIAPLLEEHSESFEKALETIKKQSTQGTVTQHPLIYPRWQDTPTVEQVTKALERLE